MTAGDAAAVREAKHSADAARAEAGKLRAALEDLLRAASGPMPFPRGQDLLDAINGGRAALAGSDAPDETAMYDDPFGRNNDRRLPSAVVRPGSDAPSTCICPRFSDLPEGTIIADLTCPIHGVDGTDPGDVIPAQPAERET